MRNIALSLTYLACTGYVKAESQQQGLTALSNLLQASNPSAAFNPSVQGASSHVHKPKSSHSAKTPKMDAKEFQRQALIGATALAAALAPTHPADAVVWFRRKGFPTLGKQEYDADSYSYHRLPQNADEFIDRFLGLITVEMFWWMPTILFLIWMCICTGYVFRDPAMDPLNYRYGESESGDIYWKKWPWSPSWINGPREKNKGSSQDTAFDFYVKQGTPKWWSDQADLDFDGFNKY